MSWQPSASIEALRQRAKVLAKIRQFFVQRDVLEVDTPAMSQATVTDVHLHTFDTTFVGPGFANGQKLYLQTSPEFHMKRLLCAGSGAIYQINKSFRNEESGRYHNPEFTMLEWYQPDYDHLALIDEVDQLLQSILETVPCEVMSYQQVFLQYLNVDPLTADIEQLRALALAHDLGDFVATEQDKDTLLQVLFCFVIEPKIGLTRPMAIYHFPASQAALARLEPKDLRVARRFEFYYRGIELANGFHELQDPTEQLARFEADNLQRQQQGLIEQPIDHHLINALSAGLPDCAGVALGVDRLVMLALNKAHINEVLSFDVTRC
ncbi:elongation factor P--(R)-beta-lysine ligase [Psychrobium sp. 1_MG-2023]|uniref:elongation factor P--(R)-beta-lysine ligase n=1 Tax=Psychrobium sp. 1_MG-2023 TaxID=3062624 RepID=UPI000C3316A2|nr:elongation factor P--(R)-beta-lysine ligase [Psychrobium sp. 1_MG-2023]MDP2560842.1 elongation factor P--(R)-beta-lysine ligase [Psychrobium sp. 1_MG-2023]PKF56716.1 elongation factor P lysine(34) lysyltransferase [Alteromonadales bacterium alter-6D02]